MEAGGFFDRPGVGGFVSSLLALALALALVLVARVSSVASLMGRSNEMYQVKTNAGGVG